MADHLAKQGVRRSTNFVACMVLNDHPTVMRVLFVLVLIVTPGGNGMLFRGFLMVLLYIN